jgi:hypothetical protein
MAEALPGYGQEPVKFTGGGRIVQLAAPVARVFPVPKPEQRACVVLASFWRAWS